MNYKLNVNEKESKEVQEYCFEIGISWKGGNEEVLNVDKQYMYFYLGTHSLFFTYGTDRSFFVEKKFILLTANEFLSMSLKELKNGTILREETNQIASDKPKFKVGDEVWIKGKIAVEVDEENYYQVVFLDYNKYPSYENFLNDQLFESIPNNKKESQELVYDLYQKIKSLTEENEKLKQVVFAKETLDQSKEIKQIVYDGRTPKASIMINSEKSIDLSEIDDDQYILRGNY